jgi:hypothetical protein
VKLNDNQIRKLFSNYQQEVYSLNNIKDNILNNNNQEIINDENNVNEKTLNDYRYDYMNTLLCLIYC